MGTGYNGLPNDYPAGLEFDYSVWTAGTKVDLVNVPFNNDYRDVVRMDSREQFNAYLNGRASSGITIENLTYCKPGEDVFLPIPFNRVSRYNYLRASNPLMPRPGDIQKDFYYFIIGAEYVNPDVTRLRLQLDVWHTYIHDVTFGNCYVERGHIGIANELNFEGNGRDYLTVPEGIDLGNEYLTVAVRNKWVMSLTPIPINDRYPGHDVLMVATTDILGDPGTKANPNLDSAEGTTFQGTTQGAGIYVFTPQQFDAFISAMKAAPWITQGITSITLIPRINRYHPDFDYSEQVVLGALATTLYPRNIGHSMFPNWRHSQDIFDYIGTRYAHLRKLWTFPYMAIEMTTFNATPIVLKPEAWNHPDAWIQERANLVPPAQRIEFSPRFYNSRKWDESQLEDLYPYPIQTMGGVKGDDMGEYVDLVTQIGNFPTMSLVNNGQIGYLAANAHGIAFQHQSADWSQQRALGMAEGQYDIASGAISTNRQITDIANMVASGQTANQNALIGNTAMYGAAGNLLGSAGGGSVFGARGAAAGAASALGQSIGSGLSAGAQMAANDVSTSLANSQRSADTGLSNRQQELMRDTNNDLARFAARGDYANTIAGINARVQDAQLIQPSTSGQMGGETMNMVNGGWQVSLRWKMIDPARIRLIGEYWLRYGYAIRAFIRPPQNLKVMSKFTYWKMSETYISASTIPEGHKQVIRGQLEKGITVWTNPDDIGNIDFADNKPLGGIRY